MSDKLRILIVDDDLGMVNTMLDILNRKGYDAQGAYSGIEALDKVKTGDFGCVLTDIKMPEMNGVELQQAISEIKPELPVVMMTAYAAEAMVQEAMQDKGAIAALAKPLDMNRLLSFFNILKKETNIVIVDDDSNFCNTLGDILEAKGFSVSRIDDPEDWKDSFRPNGQIVLLDMKLNGLSGLEVLQHLKKKYPHMPVVLLTGHRDEMAEEIEKSLAISAYTCLYKPLQTEELVHVLAQVRHQELGRMLGRTVTKNSY